MFTTANYYYLTKSAKKHTISNIFIFAVMRYVRVSPWTILVIDTLCILANINDSIYWKITKTMSLSSVKSSMNMIRTELKQCDILIKKYMKTNINVFYLMFITKWTGSIHFLLISFMDGRIRLLTVATYAARKATSFWVEHSGYETVYEMKWTGMSMSELHHNRSV
jgi:hypothetical protein